MKKPIKIKDILLLLFSIIPFILAGCAMGGYYYVELGRIRGVVTDANTGQPVSGVFVRAFDYYSEDFDYTGSDGSYMLLLDDGFYDVYFKKEDYYDEKAYDIGVFSPFTRNLDVVMTPMPSPSPLVSPSPSPSVFPSPSPSVYPSPSPSPGNGEFSLFPE